MITVPRFPEVAPQLAQNGYNPLPLYFGQKRPCAGDGWQHYELSEPDLALYADAGTGILCGRVIGLDIDVREEQLAAQIEALAEQMFGPAPRRIGLAPKVLLLLQAEAPFAKIATRGYRLPKDDPEDKAHRVEILAQGQQFVAYNKHPDTGRPYEWSGLGDPLTLPIGLLPTISETRAREFVTAAEKLLAQHGRPVGKLVEADEARSHEANEEQQARDPALLRQALAALPNDDLEYDDWVRILYAVKGAFGEQGRADFLKWSAKSKKDVPDFAAKQYSAARPSKIGAGTIYYLAQQHGWTRQRLEKKHEVEPFICKRLDEILPWPRSEIVQGLGFDDGAVAAVVGAPNAGKSAFAVSLMLAVASRAERWMGLKVAGGPAIYFASEAPASITLRARAAVSRLALPRAPAFYLSSGVPAIGGELMSSIDSDRVVATIHAVRSTEGEHVRIVLFDTLASCLGDGDENGDGMLRLVGAAKRIAMTSGVCAVLVHHPSKGDTASLRGHTSLAAACDSIVRIESDELSGIRTATLVKARDHATGLQLRFELEPVALLERDSFGDPLTTIIVQTTTQRGAPPRPSGRRQQELLGELERRYRTEERSWDEATVRKAGRDLGMPRNSLADALRGLIQAGYVTGSPSSLTLKFPPEECTK